MFLNKIFKSTLIFRILFIGCISLFIFILPLQAEGKQSPITIQGAFARASVGKVSAVFMTIHNNQNQDDHLLKAETSLEGTIVELHDHVMENGVAKMRAVDNITVPAESSVMLRPGGLHIMLFNLPEPLEVGQTFQITLTFAKAGPVTVEVSIQPMGKTMP